MYTVEVFDVRLGSLFQKHSRHLGPPCVCSIVPGCGIKIRYLGMHICTECERDAAVAVLPSPIPPFSHPSLHPSLPSPIPPFTHPSVPCKVAPRTRGGCDTSQGSLPSALFSSCTSLPASPAPPAPLGVYMVVEELWRQAGSRKHG